MILQLQLSKNDLIDERYPNRLGKIISVINIGKIVLKEAK
jgi:hypothetical protein